MSETELEETPWAEIKAKMCPECDGHGIIFVVDPRDTEQGGYDRLCPNQNCDNGYLKDSRSTKRERGIRD